jgi:hypothetical protein
VSAEQVWQLVTDRSGVDVGAPAVDRGARLRTVFHRFVNAGREMAAAAASASFHPALRRLASRGYDMHAAVAKLGLCYGFFDVGSSGANRSRDEHALREFVQLGVPHNASLQLRAISYVGLLRNRLRGHATW